MIELVVDTCLTYLTMFFVFLGQIPITEGISLLEFIFGLIIITSVIFSLIAVVRVGFSGSVRRFRSNKREANKKVRYREGEY